MEKVLFLLGCFGLGAFTWTFLEYVIHRFVGHRKKGRSKITKVHMQHHREGVYLAKIAEKMGLGGVILGSGFLVTSFILGVLGSVLFCGGLLVMFVAYEVLHKRAHTHAPMIGYGLWLRKHHFYHHFHNAKKNHGVTTPIWDLVFGTYIKVEQVRVPQKLAMPWILEDIETRIDYQPYFCLAG